MIAHHLSVVSVTVRYCELLTRPDIYADRKITRNGAPSEKAIPLTNAKAIAARQYVHLIFIFVVIVVVLIKRGR